MRLENYLKNMTDAEVLAFAERAGTKPIYLQQLVRNHRDAGFQVAVSIYLASNGEVTFEDLRPDIYKRARKLLRRKMKRKAA